MKKLIIAIVAAVIAGVVNAATAVWGTGGLEFGGTTLQAGEATGWLWLVGKGGYDMFSSYTDGVELSKALYESCYSYGQNTAAVKGQASAAGGALDMTANKSYGLDSPIYALIVYKTTQDGKDYFMGNIGYVTVTTENLYSKIEVGDMGKVIGGTSLGATTYATAWTAVPEPTSGLLLLFGLAGMALRRRW